MTNQENMEKYGWRTDVKEIHINAALRVIKQINHTPAKVVYEVLTKDESPSRVFGQRGLFLVLPNGKKAMVAEFNSYGALIIKPEFLAMGGCAEVLFPSTVSL